MALFTIDRTINFDEQKVKKVIQIIRDSNSVEDIENKMVEQGVVSLREDTEPHGFFRRRWSTFLKEFGIYDGQNLTEMANLYLNDELTSKEFVLLFLIDRVMSNDGVLIRPLEVLLKISLLLRKNNTVSSITENELKFVINNVNGTEESILKAVNTIIYNRNNNVAYNTNEQVPPCHFDIWRNLLRTAGLIDENSSEININFDLPIVKKILEYYSNTRPNDEEKYKFDSKFVGFIELPKKVNENEEILLRRQNYQSYYSEIIYNYLFEMSINNIERNILNANENGNIPYNILNGFNISTNRNDNPSNMRLYYPFKGYEGIIINKLRKTGDTIYSFIGSSIRSYLDDSFNVEDSLNEVNSSTEWLLPANVNVYDHIGALNKNGLIDWHQNRNYSVGDIVYLYGTVPYQKIIAITKVEKIDVNSDEAVDDKEFWKTQIIESNSDEKYVRLRKIKLIDDERLSLNSLLEHGLSAAPQGGMKINNELSNYIHSIIDDEVEEEDPIEAFREYYLNNLNRLKNDDNEKKYIVEREEFKKEYPIERLRELSIEEYALGTDNYKNTLSYYLEFGKYKNAGPGIGGATSAKHGFYKRDDGNYYGIKNKKIDNPIEYWDQFKNQLADFFLECKNIEEPLRASSKYPLLQGMNLVLTKLLYVYYPTKFINVCSRQKLQQSMKYFGLDYSSDMHAEELNFILNKYLRKQIKEIENNDPQYLGSALWEYINEISNNDIEEEGDDIVSNEIISIDSTRLDRGYNKIVYGIPGCGKSHYVEHEIIEKDPSKGGVFRTTFYPDYTNGDFVGQVIPKLNSKDETSILYDVQSGPFADALLNAILNPDKYTYLIIEEINRGNAAAIFGDMFQLLDRKNGSSEYPVKNYIISTFLHKSIDNKYSVDFDLDNIRIPSNLILIGTMNTSDQNVFTLDTAFKRRWKMEYIKNDIFNSKYADYKIPMSDVTWAEFVKEINDYITGENGLDINGEDKQIGAYFISSNEWDDIKTTSDPKEAAKIFAEKVLSYIWDDVAKINRDSWFDSNKYRTLDSLVTSFSEKGLEVFGDNISFTRDTSNTDNRE